MKVLKNSLILGCLFSFVVGMLTFPVFALDPKTDIQDRYSSPSKGRLLSPSEQTPVTKQPPTLEQRVDYLAAKVATLEQTVNTLQTQVAVQSQHIAQLRQVISVNSSGAVTLQSPNVLNIQAGSTLNLASSLVDVKAGLTGIHGTLKADTMISTNVISSSYAPGAGNIW
ncbi:MAG: hypothetical protein OEY91_08865 [Nitrospirota bacterium]|nr:hypothetical protein [Nitrospirota bacterium]